MINKVADSIAQALEGLTDDMTVMVGGFGTAGIPSELLEGMVQVISDQNVSGLTVVNNNAGNGDTGLAALLKTGRVRKIICSFPRQADSHVFDALYRAGKLELELVPQGNLAERLKVLFDGIHEVVDRYKPETSAVEIVFVNVNPQATLLLGQARGACITALATCNLPVAEYTALQMKQAVAGHGLAKKEQVQEMVKRLLNLPGLPGPDAADALGIAITHAHAGHSMAKLAAATELQRSTSGMYKAGRSR